MGKDPVGTGAGQGDRCFINPFFDPGEGSSITRAGRGRTNRRYLVGYRTYRIERYVERARETSRIIFSQNRRGSRDTRTVSIKGKTKSVLIPSEAFIREVGTHGMTCANVLPYSEKAKRESGKECKE